MKGFSVFGLVNTVCCEVITLTHTHTQIYTPTFLVDSIVRCLSCLVAMLSFSFFFCFVVIVMILFFHRKRSKTKRLSLDYGYMTSSADHATFQYHQTENQ